MPTKDIEKQRKYRRDWYDRNKEKQSLYKKKRDSELLMMIRNIKEENPCKCGESNPVCLQFHHLNPKEKEINIATAVSNGWSKARILKEIEKCEVLCANCHAKLHAECEMVSTVPPKHK